MLPSGAGTSAPAVSLSPCLPGRGRAICASSGDPPLPRRPAQHEQRPRATHRLLLNLSRFLHPLPRVGGKTEKGGRQLLPRRVHTQRSDSCPGDGAPPSLSGHRAPTHPGPEGPDPGARARLRRGTAGRAPALWGSAERPVPSEDGRGSPRAAHPQATRPPSHPLWGLGLVLPSAPGGQPGGHLAELRGVVFLEATRWIRRAACSPPTGTGSLATRSPGGS